MAGKEIRPQKGFQEKFIKSSVDVCFGGGAAGCGKGHPYEAEIVTPFGIRHIGDLKVGDIVSGTDGGSQSIIGIYELGDRDIYEIQFIDGSKVEVTIDHLWKVHITREDNIVIDAVIETSELFSLLDKGIKVSTPLTNSISFESGTPEYNPLQYYQWDDIRDIQDRNMILWSHKAKGSNGLVYVANNIRLANDIRWILGSLGYMSTISYISDRYNIILLPDRQREIVGYEFVGVKKARCIAVSNSNRLYVTNDFIVTHNTFISLLASAYYVDDPEYKALYVRKNLDDLTAGGGMLDECKNIYPKEMISRVTISDSPEVEFKSGARFVFTHMANESPKVLQERVKGWQYPAIFLDELTAYSFNTFTYLLSRNRGAPHIPAILRATMNPKKSCWVRKFIDFYVGADGYIDPDKDGYVRYFYNAGNSVDDVVWGDTKAEVYAKCKSKIDFFLDRARKISPDLNLSYENMIKSFTFYSGSVFENTALLEGNPDYIGSLAATGAGTAEQLLGGNWDIDDDEIDTPQITINKAESMFDNDPNISSNRYITADIAGEGEDNMVILVWYGFHLVDWVALDTTTPTEIVSAIRRMQEKHDIGNSNVIYDGVGIGNFVKGYIIGAKAFKGNNSPTISGKQRYFDLKTQCADKLIEMLENGAISVDAKIAEKIYKHKNIKEPRTFKTEFIREATALRINTLPNGKLKCLNKKDMNKKLGKGFSMDIIDPFIMRMSIDLDYKSLDIQPYNNYDENEYTKCGDDEMLLWDYLN